MQQECKVIYLFNLCGDFCTSTMRDINGWFYIRVVSLLFRLIERGYWNVSYVHMVYEGSTRFARVLLYALVRKVRLESAYSCRTWVTLVHCIYKIHVSSHTSWWKMYFLMYMKRSSCWLVYMCKCQISHGDSNSYPGITLSGLRRDKGGYKKRKFCIKLFFTAHHRKLD